MKRARSTRHAFMFAVFGVLGFGSCGTLEIDETTSDMSSNAGADSGTTRDMTADTTPGDMAQGGGGDMAAPDMSSPDMADRPDMNPPDMNDPPADMGPPPDCDYETVDGLIVIEAESLPINEDWIIASDRQGFFGTGFIEWTGQSQNGRPGSGEMEVKLRFARAGQYRMQWHNRIGMGDNPTEHNDTWVLFEDVADSYGYDERNGMESRRYPRPKCEDEEFMASVEAKPEVTGAECAEGSTRDDWFKVYSTNARDWRWSTRTSDNDAHEIGIDIDTPGVYTMLLSARGDHHLIDRIVIHERAIDDDTVHAPNNAETRCE